MLVVIFSHFHLWLLLPETIENINKSAKFKQNIERELLQ
jgi:hypothetical protein